MLNQLKILSEWSKVVQEFSSLKDAEQQELKSKTKQVQILFLKSVCDDTKIQKDIILPFYQTADAEAFSTYIESLPNCKEYENQENAIKQLLHGKVAILLPQAIYFYDVNKQLNTSVEPNSVEKSILGSQHALSENIETNINLIRHRYPSLSLTFEKTEVGTITKTPSLILYDKQLVDQTVLDEVRERLGNVNLDVVQAVGELAKAMSPQKYSLFPTMMITDRQDRTVLNIAQGKVVILLEGTPFALIVPAVFYDFFSAMDDMYFRFWISRFIIAMRYIGFFITTSFPAIYVALIAYNPEIFRIQLTVAIAGSRAAVPYPAYLEVLFMLFIMELLTEASLRLPQSIGSTATTVGGLILGQAAVQANITSSIMIIIVSAVAISNFVVPINVMSQAVRVLRYPLIFLATFFGFIGLVAGLVGILLYLCDLRSFGKPYLRISIGSSTKVEYIHEEVKR